MASRAPHNTSPYRQLDETDRGIVDFLRRDGRIAYREIARQLGVSEGMVRKRVTKLLEAGWIRIVAMSDALQLGVPILATTYAKVSPHALERVTASLAGNDATRYVAVGVGSNNVVIESLHASNAELHAFLQRELSDEVISSETMQVVEIKKAIWDWQIPAASDSDKQFTKT
jgi:Lrp/AsnC family transcriptional regulator for asnA, asnC and gidA